MRVLLLSAVLLCIAAEAPPAPNESPQDWQKAVAEVKRDLTAHQVRRLLGKSDRVSRQVLFRKHIEQWIYDRPVPVRVEFLCLPAEEARVQSVQSQSSPSSR
jgi:hypothetical protein